MAGGWREQRLRAMSEAELAAWLRSVPVFEAAVREAHTRGWWGDPRARGTATLAKVAALLDAEPGLAAVVHGLDLLAVAVLHAAVWEDGTLERADAVRLVPEATSAELDAGAATLARCLLAEHDPSGHPWLRLPREVAASVGGRGVPLLRYADVLTSNELGSFLNAHGVNPLPPLKSERVEAFRRILTDRATVERAVARLPPDARDLFWRLVESIDPVVPAGFDDVYFPYFGSTHRLSRVTTGSMVEPLARLGLVFADDAYGRMWAWREVVRCFPERVAGYGFLPPAPRPSGRPSALSGDDRSVPSVVSDLDRVLDAWRRRPPAALADGGLGVGPVRALAKELGVPAARVGVVVNAAVQRDLIVRDVTGVQGRGRNRRAVFVWLVGDTAAWTALPPVQRWAALVEWWLTSGSLDEQDGAPERLCSGVAPPDAGVARALFVRALAALPAGQGHDEEDLLLTLWWAHPAMFGPARVGAMVAVARALGLVPPTGPVGLTAAGRALLEGRVGEIAEADVTGFVVQPDHTIVAPPGLRHDVAAELATLADVESEGGATVLRVSERSVARALEQGRTADATLAFLEEHATKGVPQSLVYLVRDVERRRGNLTVVSGATVVVSDDAALVARAVKVAAAKLRAVGAHAAVSALPPAKVRAALEAKGVLGVVVEGSPPSPSPAPRRRDLYAGWQTARPAPGPSGLRVLGDEDAVALARALRG